ncbi:Nitrilase/cyanide hydratase and apolipoprotein N-acyltransferase [Paenibacillus curdlanolyticus YK9]|uniref:Nitrilase/cyanide hydratase and apolipoprotein N-acyltransferase n=1 Tax=Paenibacillus curdlanolyticus YK9 TaxID=717606 RepID=E0IC24_9BACL|nr:carbon-nitrogen family hydrolase [Paenibacillus curdlanolyticus]EFM09710.1 Nitrilase/cyanide hydratase and apolipoprotein N-acyltransferase [Paenibacillus curdlanolyticus YK9]
MTKGTLRLALLQMDIQIGQPELNFAKVESMLQKALKAEEKPDVIVLPEMWNTGYALDQIGELADEGGQRTKQQLSAFSREHGVMIVGGSIAEKRENGVFNTIYAFDRQGEVVGDYDKIHLFRLMDEEKHLQPGGKIGSLQLGEIDAGMMICYDIRFPELSRKLALGGAKVLFVPAEWPNPRLHHWRTLLQARAIENQMYVVACNRCGQSGETVFFGHSLVIDPWGEIIAESGDQEGILTASIDLALVDEVRSRIPVFEDRRPSFY